MQNKKFAFIALALLFFACKTTYKLGQCDQLFLDLEKGTINGMSPAASMDEVKKAFPCFTGETKEGSESNCGGGLFFLKHDFYFYTHNDFIEARKGFAGNVSKQVFGLSREELTSLLGTPDETLTHKSIFLDEMIYVHQYSKKWGTLSFVEEEGRITQVEMHQGKKIGAIDYCF